MGMRKNNVIAWEACGCPICVYEWELWRAIARKLDAEIMGMASDVLMEGGNETVWVNCRGSTPECV